MNSKYILRQLVEEPEAELKQMHIVRNVFGPNANPET
jgi:hypothetical protein